MFEKLLSLLLHAKGGAVATVLVLGASGALVTATVENGLTTVTITQPSTTTTGSETTTGGSTTTTTTTTTPAILALFNRTKAEEDPTGTAPALRSVDQYTDFWGEGTGGQALNGRVAMGIHVLGADCSFAGIFVG